MMLSRRRFLRQVAGASSVPWVLSTCAREADIAPGAHEVEGSAGSFTFDLHTHPGGFFGRGLPGYTGDEAFVGRIEDMMAGGMTAASLSLVADMKILERTESAIRPARAFEPGEAWADYERQLGDLRALMRMGAVRALTGLTDAETSIGAGMIAGLVAVEGGDFLEGDVERVARAYDDGVRSIQLVHYAQNDLGDLQTEPPFHHGLSAFGLDVVDAMAELGMMIDVAHASFGTVEAVAERVDVPIILSHSLLDTPERPHPRHIGADHARLIAGTGGVIGLWPSGFGSSTLDEFVDHTLRMIEVVGVDHVGLGSDMDGNYMPVIANYQDYAAWIRALGERGLTQGDVAKVAGENARRVLEAVL